MATEKYILSVEFRYYAKPTNEFDSGYNDKKFIIGRFDDFDSAANKGNALVIGLINGNYIKTNDRFSRRGILPTTIIMASIISKQHTNKRTAEVFITIEKSIEITADEVIAKFDKFSNGKVLYRNDI